MSAGSEALPGRGDIATRFRDGNYAGKNRGQFKPGESGNKSGPKPGQLQKWTLPVLTKLAKHHPEAIKRIGAIVRDEQHKDNFAACKFVCETLIRDNFSKYNTPDRGEITVRIEMAQRTEKDVTPALDLETVQIAATNMMKEQHDEEAQPEEAVS